MIPLTFVDASDYDRIGEDDRISVRNLSQLAPGNTVLVEARSPNGETWSFETRHSFSQEQIEWFKAGSALNVIRSEMA